MNEATAVANVATDAATESGELAEGWCTVSLLRLCEVIRGVSYKKGEAANQPAPGLVPLLRANNIGDGLNTRDLQYVPQARVSQEQLLRLGDVVVAMSSGSKSVVGKAGSVEQATGSTFGAFCGVLRPVPEIDARYFGFFFQSRAYRNYISEASSGTNINNLKREHFAKIEFPLPPLAEQKRIVAEIERLLAEVNKAREHLDRVPKLLKRFRQSILAAACSGQLTEDWRNTHQGKLSGDYSLERILNERQEVWEVKRNDRYKAPAEPDDEDVGELPDGWIRASVDQLTTNITSGSRDWSQYYGRGSGTFIMAQNVRPGRLDLTTRQPVDPPATSPDRARSQVERGDLLVTIVGANTGDACVVESELPEHYVCQSVALMRPTEREVAPYLGLYLNSPMHGQAVYQRYMYGEGRPHLSFEQLKRTPVHLPTPEERAEIVRRAKGLLAVADEIEMELEAASRKVQAVPQAILAKAFRGELVPTEAELARTENRPYESATQLLTRIATSPGLLPPVPNRSRHKLSKGKPKTQQGAR